MGKSDEALLDILRDSVLHKMRLLDGWTVNELNELKEIPHSFLRRNAVYRHGVTRFKPTSQWPDSKAGPGSVREVAIHRALLNDDWRGYAEMVLYHEYIHCSGFIAHNAEFYERECIWPTYDKKKEWARKFMIKIRDQNQLWFWCCDNCGLSAPRQRRANGRYLCRTCGTKLVDRPTSSAQTVT